jgi:hypothetical protein
MANQDKNFVDSVLDAQKQAVDTMVENTKKMANGNQMVEDTMKKGSEWYKNWLENQKNVFSQMNGKAKETTDKVKDNTDKMGEFYQNWFGAQVNFAKQMWEMNSNWMKNATANTTTADMNPMNMWNNWTSNWNNWMNMNQASNMMSQWQNQAQKMNPFNMENWTKATENATGIFNQYYEMLNTNFADWQKNLQNGTAQDAYRNMVNTTEGFTRFYEMWAPMWKSIQEKTFNNEMFKEMMSPEAYKNLMDKYFGFMPENSRQYMQQMTDMMNNGMKQFGSMGMGNYQQMRNMMSSMPGMNGNEYFANMLNGYNAWHSMMNNAVAPLTKMMTPNQETKTMMEWSDISNRIMVYNIKNAELQYMIYTQGAKVMDKLADNVAKKIENNEEINSLMALYQEWLNISDKVFVSLFESDAYGKLMAEVSAMQLTLRKDVETQMEKFLVGVPVATRSEMDELYKTIYDLKKQVRELEKSLVNNIESHLEETDEEEVKKAKKTTAKK